jgi:thioredoxin reductase (NADPH)
MNERRRHDLIIIGAGPAGLSAAIQAKRMGLDLAVLEKDEPGGQALAAYSIENYPGVGFGVSGKQLMNRFIEHAQKLKIDFIKCNVQTLDWSDDRFCVDTDDGELACRSAIIASGLKPKKLKIRGASELEDAKLFSYVDPTRVDHKGKRVLIIGSGDAAFDQALGFADQASSVTIAMRNATPRCLFLLTRRAERRKIKLMRSVKPAEMRTDDESVRVSFSPSGSSRGDQRWSVDADVVISCIGKIADLDLVKPLIKKSGRFPIKPGPVRRWPGLYLAGDICRGNLRQISIAAGDGMRAAMDIHTYLIESSDDENPFVHG